MEADIHSPSLEAPQFSRAVPADAAGLQPAGDTPGMQSTGQDLAMGGIRTGCLSKDTSLRHMQDPDRAVQGLQLRSSDPLRWSGTLTAEKSLRAHIHSLGNHTHTFIHVCRCQGMLVGGG